MYPSSPKTSIFGNYYNNNDTNNSSRTPSFSSSFVLPSTSYIPLEDEAVYSEFLQQQQSLSNDLNYSHHNSIIDLPHEMSNYNNVEFSTMGECSNNHGQVATTDVEPENSNSPTKIIASKRDRHSKINTARGPRDRRMRLSLDVAKKLFGLQDLLGFDKASKTVDWLITKSKTAILDLLPDQGCSFMGVSNSVSSTSECEVLSGTGTGDHQETTKNKGKCSSGISSKKQKEKISKVRKCADFHHPLAKETRQKARERARERTIVKRNNNNKHVIGGGGQDSKFRPCLLYQSMDQDVNRLGSWSPFAESQHQCIGQLDQLRSNIQFKQGFVADNSSLLMTNNWNSSYLFNYQHSSGVTHEHELNEFQIIGNSWEGNNN